MGPPKAAEVLRECLYRGADKAILLTDRRAAASDTLATSYIISQPSARSANMILSSAVAKPSTATRPKWDRNVPRNSISPRLHIWKRLSTSTTARPGSPQHRPGLRGRGGQAPGFIHGSGHGQHPASAGRASRNAVQKRSRYGRDRGEVRTAMPDASDEDRQAEVQRRAKAIADRGPGNRTMGSGPHRR